MLKHAAGSGSRHDLRTHLPDEPTCIHSPMSGPSMMGGGERGHDASTKSRRGSINGGERYPA